MLRQNETLTLTDLTCDHRGPWMYGDIWMNAPEDAGFEESLQT